MAIEVVEGIVRGIVSLPETVLTKICIVSSTSELEELMLEMLHVRRMMIGWRGVVFGLLKKRGSDVAMMGGQGGLMTRMGKCVARRDGAEQMERWRETERWHGGRAEEGGVQVSGKSEESSGQGGGGFGDV